MGNIFDEARKEPDHSTNNVFSDFLLNSGLYETMTINEENVDDWYAILNGDVRIQSYCVECKQLSVFSMEPIHIVNENHKGTKNEVKLGGYLQLLRGGRTPSYSEPKEKPFTDWRWHNDYVEKATQVIRFSYHCAMNEEHRIEFVVATDAASIRKIGQYPSVADLSFPELKEYKKVLTKEDMSEMRRAIGLHAQGIGIGSYAYLRRILERVIDKAKDKTVADGKIVPEEYSRKKVAERIKMLGDYLPDVLVSNTTVYGIISKGIHELSEDECIRYFPVLKECIMMILEKWEQERKKAESEKQLSAALTKITSKIK
ncbi:MAG: hypothetical protein SO122_03160 [Eubacteriales bacterium]|nr:hypothetical protein [Eubacteriales bacterium]